MHLFKWLRTYTFYSAIATYLWLLEINNFFFFCCVSYPPSEYSLFPLFPRDIIMKIVLTVGSHNCFKPRSENISRLLDLCCWPLFFFLLLLPPSSLSPRSALKQRHDRPIQSILPTLNLFWTQPVTWFVFFLLQTEGNTNTQIIRINPTKTSNSFSEPIVVHCWVCGVLTICVSFFRFLNRPLRTSFCNSFHSHLFKKSFVYLLIFF